MDFEGFRIWAAARCYICGHDPTDDILSQRNHSTRLTFFLSRFSAVVSPVDQESIICLSTCATIRIGKFAELGPLPHSASTMSYRLAFQLFDDMSKLVFAASAPSGCEKHSACSERSKQEEINLNAGRLVERTG